MKKLQGNDSSVRSKSNEFVARSAFSLDFCCLKRRWMNFFHNLLDNKRANCLVKFLSQYVWSLMNKRRTKLRRQNYTAAIKLNLRSQATINKNRINSILRQVCVFGLLLFANLIVAVADAVVG